MIAADLIVCNIKTLYMPSQKGPLRKASLNTLTVINDAFIAIKNGKILAIGNDKDRIDYEDLHTKIHDARQFVACPGFIDSHTHLVHASSREKEYALLNQGVAYLDILSKGGGILSTVEKTRLATFESLYDQSLKSLNQMLRFGVTTIEAKSGYGLNKETEIKQLRVAEKLNQQHPITIVSTYLGAHAIPKEYQSNKAKYIHSIMEDMITIKKENLATSVDVFCEDRVFNVDESRKILLRAKELGFNVKLHADEIVSLGGAGLGVELKATSVDHLMAISNDDILKLANSYTVANLLPGTSFYLNKNYAPARKLIDLGAIVAISGDYNPGSSPTENFQFVMHLAFSKLKMTASEILNAVTVNAAFHLKIENKGTLLEGMDADFILLDIPNLEYMFYHYGINHVKEVFISGEKVV
jgi:imidazolonepropionase